LQLHEPLRTTIKPTRPIFIVNSPVVKFNKRSLSSLGKKQVYDRTSPHRFAGKNSPDWNKIGHTWKYEARF